MMRGFSVVELVVVMLLLGILSATAMSRFVEPTAFTPETLKNAALAAGRFASQSAHARVDQTISYELARIGPDWVVTVRADGSTVQSAEVAATNSRLFVRNAGPPIELSSVTSLQLTFDRFGLVALGVAGATVLNPPDGIELEVQGDSARRVCFYPTGYVSDARCQ